MQFKDICNVLVSIEAEFDVEAVRINDLCMWPLIRQTLWFSLSQKDISREQSATVSKHRQLSTKLKNFFKKLKQLKQYWQLNMQAPDEATVLLLSRHVYLQSVDGTLLYDRIFDPLMSLLSGLKRTKKFYIGGMSSDKILAYNADVLFEYKLIKSKVVSKDTLLKISRIAEYAELDQTDFIRKFINNYQMLDKWIVTGEKLFSRYPMVQTVYMTSWYFPDMMGLCVAAQKKGITVIDVQHGQQGKFQGMYSWWSKVPSKGYLLMPNKFWCWGQKSIENITNSGHENMSHIPFLGGYPWLDFYQHEFNKPNLTASTNNSGTKKILFTLQAPDGEHKEVIPDFILDFLASHLSKNIILTFRCHPNYTGCTEYISQRLAHVSENKYNISAGNKPLYGDLLEATHHLTACSTCSYEADALSIPTMLFGVDSLTIYQEEIKNKTFSWTSGHLEDLVKWLGTDNIAPKSGYIISSLDLAKKVLVSHNQTY